MVEEQLIECPSVQKLVISTARRVNTLHIDPSASVGPQPHYTIAKGARGVGQGGGSGEGRGTRGARPR